MGIKKVFECDVCKKQEIIDLEFTDVNPDYLPKGWSWEFTIYCKECSENYEKQYVERAKRNIDSLSSKMTSALNMLGEEFYKEHKHVIDPYSEEAIKASEEILEDILHK